ncbi:MAG TPA: OpgC domain-containing protein, partial [Burkholderiaceae bacterium]|nr:OpgC domain-containing protein [Burkholderiaceae bacterium]
MSDPALPPPRRYWEIDAMRGLMLVLMTLTHVPTRFTD